MPFINSGIYIDTSVKEKSYEIETSYYLEFQIKSALISIDKLRCFSENSFDNKYQYYHFYTDHLLYSLGQIANRFIVNDKDKGVVLERKKANCRDFEFNAEKYPNLSDKTGRNTIEHIDEHNQKIIEKRKGVGGFNLIDNETETDLINMQEGLEIYGKEEQQMTPNYYIVKLPDEQSAEFINSIPFTPKSKQNMTALMVARNDGDHYGELVLYTVPKSKTVYGPMQIEAQINQNTEISADFTLWSSKGTTYSRGNLFIIPIEDSLVYVEPVYLEASASASSAVACMVWPSCQRNSLVRRNGRVFFSQRTTEHHWL